MSKASKDNRLYIIPPGVYLSVSGGCLVLSRPAAPHGARLPFDFLLHSMAEDCGNLGSAETIGAIEGRFDVVSKVARIYRHIGRSRPGEFGFLAGNGDAARGRASAALARTPAPQTNFEALGPACCWTLRAGGDPYQPATRRTLKSANG